MRDRKTKIVRRKVGDLVVLITLLVLDAVKTESMVLDERHGRLEKLYIFITILS